MFNWLISTAIGRIVAVVAAGLFTSGILFAGCQVRGCIKAKEELRQYHQADKIRKQDKKTDRQIQEKQDEIDSYTTPDDFQHGFDRLRSYGE